MNNLIYVMFWTFAAAAVIILVRWLQQKGLVNQEKKPEVKDELHNKGSV